MNNPSHFQFSYEIEWLDRSKECLGFCNARSETLDLFFLIILNLEAPMASTSNQGYTTKRDDERGNEEQENIFACDEVQLISKLALRFWR